jgi:hypothetical protein
LHSRARVAKARGVHEKKESVMPRVPESEIDYGPEDRTVHEEPMHATLGDKLSGVEGLRERLGEEERTAPATTARSRFFRSLENLEHTFARAVKDVGTALRGTADCAVAWGRAEIRGISAGATTKKIDHAAQA